MGSFRGALSTGSSEVQYIYKEAGGRVFFSAFRDHCFSSTLLIPGSLSLAQPTEALSARGIFFVLGKQHYFLCHGGKLGPTSN